ncbi:MAG: DinB family protein [Acidobacteriota bacterium]|nr:DinB family protein [Acidobacteriota bacterium]
MHNSADFLNVWKMESASTLKVFRALTDAALPQAVVPGGYTLQSLAWHITGSINAIPAYAGFFPPPEKKPAPATVAEIVAAYEANSAHLAAAVNEKGSDAFLAESADFFGHKMRRGALLSLAIMHQAHHRAQMTVLLKQAGLKVPGVYGPSEDDVKDAKK